MKTRTFGRTGWKISEIGFGAWGIGAAWWGKTDDAESLASLRAAWDAGVNFYDTAYVYGDGHSERLIAKALAQRPARGPTKTPPRTAEGRPKAKTRSTEAFPADWIRSCTERTLKTLGRDTVDLTQFHVWTDRWIDDDGWKEAVARLKKEGK